MDDVTLAELTRRVDEQGRRFSDYARKDVYERDMQEIRHDIAEIRGSVRFATRTGIGVFITLIVQIIIQVLDRLQ